MNRRHVHDSLSEYLEGALPSPERQVIEEYLAKHPEIAREANEFRAMLQVLHELPRREPVLNLWAEMESQVATIQTEERLGLLERLRLRVGRFLSNFAAGTILFTQAVAVNTEARMRKYLITDPFVSEEA